MRNKPMNIEDLKEAQRLLSEGNGKPDHFWHVCQICNELTIDYNFAVFDFDTGERICKECKSETK